MDRHFDRLVYFFCTDLRRVKIALSIFFTIITFLTGTLMPNPFTETYRSFTTIDLLEILQQPDLYQQAATEAAREEIAQRKLSDEQLSAAQSELEQREAELNARAREKSKIKDAVVEFGVSVVRDITPSQEDLDTNKKIRVICYALSAIAIYDAYKLVLTIIRLSRYSRFFDVLSYLPIPILLLLAIGIYHFWHKRKMGWILLMIFATYTALGAVVAFLSDLLMGLGGDAYLRLFPKHTLLYFLISILYIALMIYLNRADIRDTFQIDKRTSNKTIILTSLSVFVLMLFSFVH